MLLQSLLLANLVQSCLLREIEFQTRNQKSEILPNPVTSSSLFPVYTLVWNLLCRIFPTTDPMLDTRTNDDTLISDCGMENETSGFAYHAYFTGN